MTSDMLKILNEQSNSFIAKVKDNLSKTHTTATGKTAGSIYYKLIEEGTKITIEVIGARPFFATVETGRKPTPEKGPSASMIANITDWVNARGKPHSAIWAIATKIQKEGTELFKKGGRKDIYSNEIDGFIDELSKAVIEQAADELIDVVYKTFIGK